MSGAVGGAYADAVDAWAAGPAPVYGRLAAALVDHSPLPLAGARVLDLGAGTGTVSSVAGDRGARVTAVDLASQMLRHDAGRRPPGVAGDALALPFRGDRFDVAVAACLINHFVDPVPVIREAARTVRPGGAVLASSLADRVDPVKASLDQVAAAHGWTPPDWYLTIKHTASSVLGDAAAVARVGSDAGLVDVRVAGCSVAMDMGPAAIARYRFGLAHFAAWLARLGPEEQAAVRVEAEAAVAELAPTWSVDLLVLAGRV